MNTKQRKFLKSQAHHLKPVIIIGKRDIDDAIIQMIDQSIRFHELIKIKFNHHKSLKENLINQINKKINSETVGMIGNIAIIYRQNEDTDQRNYCID